jgi:diadenosine tetraphosphate (Ap4A) HIT family hydrolase
MANPIAKMLWHPYHPVQRRSRRLCEHQGYVIWPQPPDASMTYRQQRILRRERGPPHRVMGVVMTEGDAESVTAGARARLGRSAEGAAGNGIVRGRMNCVFCERVTAGDFLCENEAAVAFLDVFPLSPGHSLIIPRRREPDFLRLTTEEGAAVWRLLSPVRDLLEQKFRPDGYNLGVNVGVAAGQTVDHAHLHVVPRYAGDVPEPRGGIRWIIPAKAVYWRR